MKIRAKVTLGLVIVVGVALVGARVAANRTRALGSRARLRVVERHFADLATSTATLEQQVQALAMHVAALEARLEQCGCSPPPRCTPCQQQGLCTADGAACGQDADGDGSDDCLDQCPCDPGPADHGGCPAPPCDLCPCTIRGQACGHDADGD